MLGLTMLRTVGLAVVLALLVIGLVFGLATWQFGPVVAGALCAVIALIAFSWADSR